MLTSKFQYQLVGVWLICIVLTACDAFGLMLPIDEPETILPESTPYTLEPDVFCEDERPPQIIESLQSAVQNRDGEAFARLIAPDGLYLSLNPSSAPLLSMDEVRGFFEDETVRDWGNTYYIESIEHSLAGGITDSLVKDLLPDNVTIACNDNQDGLSNRSVLYNIIIPGREVYDIPNFYSVMRPAETDLLWGAWGIAFEYWDGQPMIFALTHYGWTP